MCRGRGKVSLKEVLFPSMVGKECRGCTLFPMLLQLGKKSVEYIFKFPLYWRGKRVHYHYLSPSVCWGKRVAKLTAACTDNVEVHTSFTRTAILCKLHPHPDLLCKLHPHPNPIINAYRTRQKLTDGFHLISGLQTKTHCCPQKQHPWLSWLPKKNSYVPIKAI